MRSSPDKATRKDRGLAASYDQRLWGSMAGDLLGTGTAEPVGIILGRRTAVKRKNDGLHLRRMSKVLYPFRGTAILETEVVTSDSVSFSSFCVRPL